ncbi:glycoside hydrolase family 88 protein [Aestuariibaculum lutulentum]|uniref:Glycoside hydrolase family 88 protein n=1 Tax=Aestuariibaculum lutulentum TaxID=2920935 RepID=A0ABS9RJS2_9FLAO|nr:glycoside hydrolase family 88 protein [Aestuariibaculum lutulentum]MCH4553198.1 glycoside hydrolase family 88 protein [Aestuariibaculum lutulentum]
MIKNIFKSLTLLSVILILLGYNNSDVKPIKSFNKIVKASTEQYTFLSNSIYDKLNSKRMMPRSIRKNGETGLTGIYDWTSGFYPGSLWYLNLLTNDSKWETLATQYTERLDSVQYWKENHDIGFMMECSYGNALKKSPSKAYDDVIVQTAKSLVTRFRPKAGIIQSWNASKQWNCPVIVDNMMNLELLFHATKISGDSTYYNVAVSHANTTMKNHFRTDYSSYHVLNYDTETGEILAKKTHQGYADDSSWARGQAWGLYGFTLCYRETKDPKYLEQALHIADYIKNHPNLPKDNIPYWDYNVPLNNDTPRDASAAAITASALYELCTFLDKKESKSYKNFANSIINSLSSPDYFAEPTTNNGFLLKHSVGSLPHNSEIDVPLNYADYYFLEALYRQKTLK